MTIKNRRNAFKLNAISGALALIIAQHSYAQLEEVVVTAEKRSESVQDVPIAINALTGDMMDKYGVNDTDDVEAIFPNLSTHNTSSANSGFTIRGVGTDNFHISAQQSVTTYIDDVALGSPFVSTIGVFDVERVEVLRGPQNTLYGRNTIGGAVNFHSKRAEVGDELHGRAGVVVGQGGQQELEFALGIPMGEKWAARIAGKSAELDGHLEDVLSGKDVGGYDRQGFRLSLAGDLSDRTSLEVIINSGETEGDSSMFLNTGNFDQNGNACAQTSDVDSILKSRSCTYQQVLKPGELAPGTALGDLMASDPSRFVTVGSSTFVNLYTDEGEVFAHPDGGYEGDNDGINIYLEHELENITINSITSYSETYFQGNNYRSLHGFSSHQEGDWESFSQEIRLTSTGDGDLQWITGLYYAKDDSQQDTWVVNMRPGGPVNGVNPGVFIDSEYENIGAYAQFDYTVNDRLNLTLGIRYTEDELNGQWAKRVLAGPDGSFVPSIDMGNDSGRDFITANDTGGVIATVPNPIQELSEFGWKIGFDYQLDNGMIYGSVSTGFKGGAYDNRALSNGSNPIGPEFVDAYELGYKAEFMDNTVQLNLAAFLYLWEEQQLFETNPVSGQPETLNIGETELKGFEVDLKWAPNESFYIQAGLGVTDAEITEPGPEAIAANSAADKGDEVPNVPGSSANLLAVYTIPFGDNSLDLQLSYRRAGEYYHNFQQEEARSKVKAHDWLNMRATYLFGDEQQHSIALFGNNLTGEYYCSDLDTGLPSGNNWSCQIEGNSYGEATWGMAFSTEF